MIAREESIPPDASAASTPGPTIHNDTPPPSAKKRKHAAISGSANRSNAASPAPMDPAYAGAQAAGASVLPTTDSSSLVDDRPRLTVSRPPVFVPVSEGSIYHTTEQVAVNRLGFRYIPAGLSEPGSKLAYRTIESYPPGYVRASWEDRSHFVKVTTDGLGLCGEKGYRSARLNVPVREGKWYLEIKVELGGGDGPPDSNLKEGAHVRLGWGRREAGLNCPVGLDGYSYGYRDKDGRKVTLSRPRPYSEKYGSGDVIGLYISLPPKRKPKANDPNDPANLKRERIAIDFKGQAYFESVEYPQSKEMIALMDSSTNKAKDTSSVPSSAKKSATVKNLPERGRGNKPPPEPAPFQHLPVLRGSHIAFFVNGRCQGIAFQDLFDYLQLRTKPSARNQRSRRRLREGYVEHTENPFDDGTLGYYPFISLFNGARVRINAGPDFEFSPPMDIDGVLANDPDSADTKARTWRPLCERYAEFMQEQRELDARDEVEAQRKAQEIQDAPNPLKKERAVSDHPRSSRPPTQHPRPHRAHPKAPSSAVPSPKPASSPAPAELTSSLVVQHPSSPEVKLRPDVPTPTPIEHQQPSPSEPAPALEPEPAQEEAPAEASASQTGAAGVAESTTEMTEHEKKLEARRQRKRELERARRAKKREERLAIKKQEEDQKQAAAVLAAAFAAISAAGLPGVNMNNLNIGTLPTGQTAETLHAEQFPDPDPTEPGPSDNSATNHNNHDMDMDMQY
ncbi:ASH2 [Sanghuangporus weigelae]